MKKVLITGGAGYVGGYLTDLLITKGYDVTVYDNLIYEDRYLKDVKFIFGDVRDRQKLASLLPDFDYVIWLAAIVGDGACAVDPYLTQSINEDAVKWLVDNYKGKIIFPSTCSVYGVNNELIDETAAPNPLSIYASTKLAAEQYILQNAAEYPLVFRLGTLYGISDYHSRIRLDLVVNILSKRAALGESLTVFGGEQWRPLLHVKDVASAMLFGMTNNLSGLYNLSSSNSVISDITKEIEAVIPNTVTKYQDMKFEDLRNYRVKNDKFAATGWKPSRNLADGIMEIFKVVTENRYKDINDPLYSNVDYLKKIWRNR